ncbi:hypothetical protein [Alkalilimnicola sp. S0819]|uniref:hypothetical protein n=1 Tax=Alkalilimnicola sp. S0819 TaxID=2613922 RepID=UPI0012619CFE|nr:hypothetical protein [Alkalilimnicola sp. S0819]KAB7619471.1 hypothetical protein F3N43_13700 [Alkalilimnicola sp. S0819]MPQ17691.1 hypothetical protein [Alkalilimnicola sp. S0819]
MLVRFLGFHVETPASLPLSELMESLAKEAKSYNGVDEPGRFLFVDADTDPNYYLGLIVTVKNQRTFCELRDSGKGFKVIVNKLDKNSNIMEFNFFVLNKRSHVGLYQHYHQSCSLGQGMRLLKKSFYQLKGDKRQALREKLKSEGKTEDDAQELSFKKYKGYFKWEILVMKDNLEKVLAELKRIKFLEVELAYLEPEVSEFGQLSEFVRKQRRKLSFIDSPVSALASAIVNSLSDADVEGGRVAGIDDEGLDRVIKIQNNPDNFGEMDYDSVAAHLHDLNVVDFTKSWVIAELKRRCEDRPEVFKATIK